VNDEPIYPVPEAFARRANLTPELYKEMYAQSVSDPEGFWSEQGKRIEWMTPYTRAKNVSWEEGDFGIEWYADGVLNVSANCIDRHLDSRGDKPAIIWEGDSPDESETLTYRELHVAVCKFANVLKANGVKKGDRITIYMPMILEASFAMLACARIGAVHSVVFGGFSPDALAGRITDCDSTFIITADEGLRGTKSIPLKDNCDAACEIAGIVKTVLTVKRTGGAVNMAEGRDVWLHEALDGVSDDCPPEPMKAEDPLFILYTSGSTGKPKGVLHSTGGYLVWASITHEYVFDLKEEDVYWCTADVGWVTGHTYIVYGPLANGATTVRYFHTVGEGRCPIVDTWWQTETGGAMIVPLPGAANMKPGAASHPFFGIVPELVDADGKELHGETEGNLIITDSWPGQMRTVYGDHQRFKDTYFAAYPGNYFTGDGCKRDADGFYWITGRVDDVINVSGHRMGTAEVESALVSHDAVAEAAVVGYPHDIKGQGIYAYVTVRADVEADEALYKDLITHVRAEIGPIATPDLIQFAPGLPKTRSGKIMRRILRKIAENEFGNLGDISTLAEPEVVDELIQNRQNKS